MNFNCLFSEIRSILTEERIITELRKMLRLRTVNSFFLQTDRKINKSALSFSILNPFLSNVYYNRLDRQIYNLQVTFCKKKKHRGVFVFKNPKGNFDRSAEHSQKHRIKKNLRTGFKYLRF